MHSLLKRQLAKLGLREDGLPLNASDWAQLLKAIDMSYAEADQDRHMMEHSLEICSGEMMGLYEDLKQTSEIRVRQSEQALAKSEQQLRQAQKLEAIGQLAGGVAHDFNNVLSVIMNYSELLLPKLREGDPLRTGIEEIRKASVRGANLTRQLLAFSRQQILQPQVLNLNDVLRGIKNMLARIVGDDIQISVRTDPKLGLVEADPNQVEQVLMNLVVNARDAMPKGGNITIETSNVELREQDMLGHPGTRPGLFVLMSVVDSGTGMSADTMARMFEPFFTTKERGKGTGLGLATVLGIVEQSKGLVFVESAPGKGTTFKVYFPSTDKKIRAELSAAKKPESLRGSETILLVEDEPQLRTLLNNILRGYGYRVIEAGTPLVAVSMAAGDPGPIHLLVTDVVMPEMSGDALAERLSKDHPDLRVLFISGYAGEDLARRGIQNAAVTFLQKPFTPDLLAQRIRQILDGPALK